VTHTAYPGNRSNLGGGGWRLLWRTPLGWFLPFTSEGLDSEVPNATSFMDFFPLGLVLALWVQARERKVDCVLLPVTIVAALFAVYMSVGLPEALAKITLLGRSLPERTNAIFGLANVILLVRSAALTSNLEPMRPFELAVPFAAAAAAVALAYASFSSYLTVAMVAIMAVTSVMAILAVSHRRPAAFAALAATAALWCGMPVNPIQRGSSAVSENPLVAAMRDIAHSEEGTWIAAVGWRSNVTLYAGAPTLNSCNIYPNMAMWHTLDPTGAQEDVYNRYAHVNVSFVTEQTHIELQHVDVVNVYLNPDDIPALGARYVLAAQGDDALDLSTYQSDTIRFEELARYDNDVIYRAVY